MKIDNASIYGRMPENVEHMVSNVLMAKPGHDRKKRYGLAIAAAALVVMLACTALAVSLARSARVQAVQRGREAIFEAYGFTPDTLGLFRAQESNTEDGWVVAFLPIKYEERLGAYQVTLAEGAQPVVSWSYDDAAEGLLADMAAGGLDSPLWGPEQVQRALALDEAYVTAYLATQERSGNVLDWSLEERAALDAMLADGGYHERAQRVNILPEADDLQPADAMQMARERIEKEFGLPVGELDAYQQVIFCVQMVSSGAREYSIVFTTTVDYNNFDSNDFWVNISLDTGRVVDYGWNGSTQNARLPDGPLEDKEVAVRTFFNAGAFEGLSHAQKADLAQRLARTSYGRDLLGGVQYALPADGAVEEQWALDAAAEALQSAYGLTPAMMDALFITHSSYQDVAGYGAWVVEIAPNTWSDVVSRYRAKLGTYRVVVEAEGGEVRVARWSLAGIPQREGVTDENWASQSRIWDQDVLTRAMALQNAIDALAAEYQGEAPLDNYEYRARWSTLMREAGFDRKAYSQALPTPGDIQREEAISIATQALCDEFGRTLEQMEAYRVAFADFSVADADRPEWQLEYYAKEPGKEDFYRVWLDGRTGEILNLEYVAQGNG